VQPARVHTYIHVLSLLPVRIRSLTQEWCHVCEGTARGLGEQLGGYAPLEAHQVYVCQELQIWAHVHGWHVAEGT